MILNSPFPDIEVPRTSLTQFVLGDVSADRDAIALIDGATGRTMTYGGLADRTHEIAQALAAHGVSVGDVAAIHLPNCPEYAVLFHGIVSAGAAVTPVNHLHTSEETAHQLRDSRARILFTWPDGLETAREAIRSPGVRASMIVVVGERAVGSTGGTTGWSRPGEIGLDAFTGTGRNLPLPALGAENLAALPYSSGTTGVPKGVMLSHRNLIANVLQNRPLSRIGRGSVTLAALPLSHIYGVTGILNLALHHRATVVTLPRFDLASYLETVQKHQVDHLFVAPPLALTLAKHPLVDSYDLGSVELITSAAAPLGRELAQDVADRLACGVTQAYGLTEASPATHCIPHDRPDIDKGSIGVLLPNVQARVVDPVTGRDTVPGEAGELWCRGPNVMLGYFDNPAATAATVDADGFLRTGDLVTVTDEGVFTVVGRLKELIKYKGHQVAPAELEAVVLSHPGIRDAAVVGALDANGEEIPKAFVVPEPGTVPDASDVLAFVADRVAPYKKIRALEYVDTIPKSPAGKILRQQLHGLRA
ncbi:AMP-binding protein [Streptomyces sp. NPDC046881]|uniref:AMP-binding protein n=1 Tax=Streptomyces sp. NPDC046881 TaxID=3155374 RepID=UPI00340C8E32